MRIGKAILSWLAVLHVGNGFGAEQMPDWPVSWRRDYGRFESFLEKRAVSWPRSQLTISPSGVVDTGLDFVEELTSHQAVEFFSQGTRVASAGVPKGEVCQVLAFQTHGIPLAADVLVSGAFGYQHILPLVWLEILPERGEELSFWGGENRTIRILPQPEPEASFWPNNRLVAWLDYQVMPSRHPNDIHERNRKVDPSVFLQVDMSGTIRRELLNDSAAEGFLRWRIFYNGQLIKDSSATNVKELTVSENGPGNYLALVGIEGPQGFLPVSNLLTYSLAPEGAEGALQLLFCHFDYQRRQDYPQWYREIIPPPLGDGPMYFERAEKLEATRTRYAAWKGCASLFNASDAVWVYYPPGTPRKLPEGSVSP